MNYEVYTTSNGETYELPCPPCPRPEPIKCLFLLSLNTRGHNTAYLVEHGTNKVWQQIELPSEETLPWLYVGQLEPSMSINEVIAKYALDESAPTVAKLLMVDRIRSDVSE